jgi:hypothetical protein
MEKTSIRGDNLLPLLDTDRDRVKTPAADQMLFAHGRMAVAFDESQLLSTFHAIRHFSISPPQTSHSVIIKRFFGIFCEILKNYAEFAILKERYGKAG